MNQQFIDILRKPREASLPSHNQGVHKKNPTTKPLSAPLQIKKIKMPVKKQELLPIFRNELVEKKMRQTSSGLRFNRNNSIKKTHDNNNFSNKFLFDRNFQNYDYERPYIIGDRIERKEKFYRDTGMNFTKGLNFNGSSKVLIFFIKAINSESPD